MLQSSLRTAAIGSSLAARRARNTPNATPTPMHEAKSYQRGVKADQATDHPAVRGHGIGRARSGQLAQAARRVPSRPPREIQRGVCCEGQKPGAVTLLPRTSARDHWKQFHTSPRLPATMPWTFAHPAAVLPLKRLGPQRVNFAALAIGSLVPDFGYYAFQFQGTWVTHTFLGSITLCPLLGLVLLACFNLVREPLCYMLPQPHRAALLPLARAPVRKDITAVAVAALCVILGAWTHILWDSFTHKKRWFVDRIEWLQAEVFAVQGHVLHGYSLLQYLSSVAGVGLMLWAYWSWLRTTPAVRERQWFERADRWRYGCIFGAAALASLVVLPWAFKSAASIDGSFWVRVFVVRWLVGTTSGFAACFTVIALVCYRRQLRDAHRKPAQ
jgi:hypothetical protein